MPHDPRSDDLTGRQGRAARLPLLDVDPADERAVAAVVGYVSELDRVFRGGFDPGPGSLDDGDGWFILVLDQEQTVACAGLRRLDPGRAEIKRMWVHPEWRGAGLASRLLAHLEHTARRHGFGEVVLDTAAELVAARRLYARRGYREVPAYNDNTYARHWFAKRLHDPTAPR